MECTPAETVPPARSYATYAAMIRADEARYAKLRVKEVALIRNWLRDNLDMTIPPADTGITIRYFSGTRVYLWNCLLKARVALGLRKLGPEPIMSWIHSVFNVKVIYDIETIAAAIGFNGTVPAVPQSLAEHDKTLAEVFATLPFSESQQAKGEE